MSTQPALDLNALQVNRNFAAKEYWKERFYGFEFRNYFFNRQLTQHALQSSKYATCVVRGSQELGAGLDKLAPSGKAKHIVLLSALGVLIQKYMDMDDVCVLTPVYDDKKHLVPVRMGAADGSFKRFLSIVKSDVIADMEHGMYAVDRLLNEEGVGYRESYHMALSVKEVQPVADAAQAKAGMAFNFTVDGQVTLNLAYDVTKFDSQYIQYLAELYLSLLQKLINEPGKQVGQVDILSEEERSRLMQVEKVEYSNETVIDLFDRQQGVAASFKDQTITYAELKHRSELFASYLLKQGVQRGELVCVVMERSIDLLIAILGILKAGAAYVPVDPAWPEARIQSITEGRLVVKEIQSSDAIALPQLSQDDLAYVIYTSGSTGKPKGVMITHGSLFNYISWAAEHYVQNKPEAFALFTSIAFDLTVTSIFTPLVTGGQIIIAPMEENKASVMKLTPSHLRLNIPVHAKKLIVGGEQLDTVLAKSIPGVEIYNEYGPTEATVGCMIYRFDEHDELPAVPIGSAIANTQIYLLNKDLQPVVTGAEGEIYIAGAGLAKGYYDNEELTAERFPLINGQRMYRTGDVGVWLPDGRMLYRGRADEQVKIRGFRIEPGEIEHQLLTHPQITSAVVIAKESQQDKYLVAYYVSNEELPLREYLQQRLPDYMVPAFFVKIQNIPLTVNGKLDKASLPDPMQDEEGYVAPSTDTEKKLVHIWAETLKRDAADISVAKSFFELGVNSLTAIVLANKIFKQLNVKISLREFFNHGGLRELAKFIDNADKSSYSAIRKVLSKPYYKVSSAQKRLYFLYESNKNSIAYNVLQVVQLEGALDTDRLQDAFKKLVARHESLRTYFEIVRGELVQKIAEQSDFNIEMFQAAEQDIPAVIKQFRKPFSLNSAPLIRAGLIQVSEHRHILMADMHHITADGIAQTVLVKDFMALYNHETLPALRLQYKDYAEWQQSPEEQEQLEKHKQFWLNEFASLPPALDLPADNVRPSAKDFKGSMHRFQLDREQSVRLKAIAEAQGVTLFMLLLSAYNILLSKLGNKDDIVVGTSTAGRQHPDLEKIIGIFVNMLTIRNHVKGESTFGEFLATVKAKTLACFEHQSYQYEQLIEELKLERNPGRNPLFDVMFDFHNFETADLAIPGLSVKPYGLASSIAKFDLTLSAFEQEDCLHFNLEYATALFSEETIARFVGYFRKVIEAITDVNVKIASIDILSEEERSRLMQFEKVEYSNETVIDLFDRQQGVAASFKDQTITYAELKQRSELFASYLLKQGVQRGELVCVVMERSIDLLIAILGILKAGAAYVPVDPAWPEARIQSITEGRLVVKEIQSSEPTTLPELSQDDLAYVIYTSGSTGKPKGVMITHGSLFNYISWAAEHYVQNKPETFALFTSIAFDLTVTSIFTPLVTGGQIIIAPLEENKAAVVKLTPSHLRFHKPVHAKKLIVGGEQLDTALAKSIPGVEIYNEYGPTEATVGCMIYRFDEHDELPAVPIGSAIANTQIYLLNKDLQPVVTGAEGEIYIAGAGLAKGYYDNEELTAERFPTINGQRMYRTGDVGVWLPDGRMLYRGRADEQVKIRGFRIEPGEIEHQLLTHPQITSAVVIAKERQQDKYLVAYYVSNEELSLREYLHDKLPDYMVPSFFVKIQSIPLTINGKLDKKQLPDPELQLTQGFVAPANETERKLVEIWAEVLRLEPATISTTQSFFELGGHSLRAVELINKIHKDLSVEISLDDVFDNSDIVSLSAIVAASAKNEYLAIPKSPKKEHYALSPTQKGMFFLNKLDPQSLAYNMPRVIKLEGSLNKEKIAATFQKLVDRYEVFRTAFEVVNETPVQKIYDQVDLVIEEHRFNPEEVASITQKLIRPFDLGKAPLLRVGIVEVNENENFLMVDTHHIIMDGTSNGILINSFVDLYNEKFLPQPALQYKDYTEWLQSPARQQSLAKQKEFWQKEFAGGLPMLELPLDFTRPLIKSHEGSTIDFKLTAAEVRKVRSIEESEECTLFMVLIATYYVLLAKISGQEDIVVGASVSNRKHEDLKEMLGLFLDSIPIRNYPKKELSFRRFLKEVKSKTLSCFENQSYDYEEIASELNVGRDARHNALFDVMFAVQNFERAAFKLPGLHFTTYSRTGLESKFDLTLTATEQQNQIGFSLEYCSKLFTRATAERFIEYFRSILSVVLSNLDVKLGEIEIISEEEKQQILTEFNSPAVPLAEKTVIDLFEESVRQSPNTTAILFKDEALTYEQLNQRVNQLSHYLRPNDAVAVCFERSPEMIIALLAILKAGAFYIAMEPHLPTERMAAMIKESNVKCVLTNISDLTLDVEVINVVKESDAIAKMPHTDPGVKINADQLAYVIYTSGSTGTPKGIQVRHSSLLDYALTFKDHFSVTASDKVIQQSSLSFDTSVEEIFPALISGAMLIVMPDAGMDVQFMVQSIKREQATILSTTPLVLNELNAYADEMESLRLIISGGDVLKPAYIDKLIGKYPLYNTYGPSESTVCITYNQVTSLQDVSIIGRPIRNREVLLLNASGGLCPVGIAGELCVSGAGLAVGYINNPSATRERFIPHPYKQGARLYRTGDLAKWLPDGRLEFLGRIDDQVKIRGFRVEPGEIETVLKEFDGVKEAAVLVSDHEKDRSLVAFVVLADDAVTITAIRKHLRSKLANYMMPSQIVRVDRIPYNNNGKTDKDALFKNIALTASAATGRKPETPTQQKLAEIWKDLLGIGAVSLDDTFFDLGGHSLLIIKSNERIKKTFNVQLPVKLFFYQTLEQLSQEIDKP